MKKTMTLAVIALITLCFAFLTANNAVANKGPADMVLKTAKGQKPAAFPHAKHQEINKCEDCHHTADATGKKGPYKAGEEKKCNSCHNKDMGNKKLNSFKNAAHERCKGCHKEANKAGNDKAPTKCAGCHPADLK